MTFISDGIYRSADGTEHPVTINSPERTTMMEVIHRYMRACQPLPPPVSLDEALEIIQEREKTLRAEADSLAAFLKRFGGPGA